MTMRLYLFAVMALIRNASAVETLGHLYVQDVLVRPYFEVAQPEGGNFSLGESSFALQWSNDELFSSYIMIGQRSLINQEGMYVTTDNDHPNEFTFVEAYGQASGSYGQFRLGMIPIEYGAEGQLRESELIFPRSLIFERGIVGLRDLGASYAIQNEGFFTRVVVHNGEAGENTDGRLWYTGAWGWSNENNFQVGAMGSTGSTTPASTLNSTYSVAGFDPTRNSKWRLFGGFLKWYPKNWKFLLEGTGGELLQGGLQKFYVGHFDAIYDFSQMFSGLLRYDELNPNSTPTNDHTRYLSAGVAFRTAHDTMAIYFIATEVFEQGHANSNQFRLVLRLTPIPTATIF
jgi:hypothetical protein